MTVPTGLKRAVVKLRNWIETQFAVPDTLGSEQPNSEIVARYRADFFSVAAMKAFAASGVTNGHELLYHSGMAVNEAGSSHIIDYLQDTPYWRNFFSSPQDPTFLGWMYQYWNHSERDSATWAISRGEESGVNRDTISYATQIYTEGYMSKFLARQCLSTLQKYKGGELFRASISDPACGAGNILVAVLDELLTAAGSDDSGRTIDALLGDVELSGVDIDPFAVTLARLSLVISAASHGASFVALSAFAKKLSNNIVSLRPPLGTLERGASLPNGGCYDAIITNPPYVGRRKLEGSLRDYLSHHYPSADGDIATAFKVRCLELLRSDGQLGLVTSDKWLRLKGYQKLRWSEDLFSPGIFSHTTVHSLVELGGRAFHRDADLHDGVGVTLVHLQNRQPSLEHIVNYLDLAPYKEITQKIDALRKEESIGGADWSTIAQSAFSSKQPNTVLLSASTGGADWLTKTSPLKMFGDVEIGIQTNDDQRFVAPCSAVTKGDSSWVVHHRGGGTDAWYGLNRWMLNIAALRESLRGSVDDRFPIEESFAREGWTYSWFANGKLALRKKERGWSFGRAAASAVFVDDLRVIGFLNSPVASQLAKKLAGKVQFTEGVIREIPVPRDLSAISEAVVIRLTEIAKILTSQDPREYHYDPLAIDTPLKKFTLEREYLELTTTLNDQVRLAAQSSALGKMIPESDAKRVSEELVVTRIGKHHTQSGEWGAVSLIQLSNLSGVAPARVFELLEQQILDEAALP